MPKVTNMLMAIFLFIGTGVAQPYNPPDYYHGGLLTNFGVTSCKSAMPQIPGAVPVGQGYPYVLAASWTDVDGSNNPTGSNIGIETHGYVNGNPVVNTFVLSGFPGDHARITDLAISPSGSRVAFVARSDVPSGALTRFYYSSDGGATFNFMFFPVVVSSSYPPGSYFPVITNVPSPSTDFTAVVKLVYTPNEDLHAFTLGRHFTSTVSNLRLGRTLVSSSGSISISHLLTSTYSSSPGSAPGLLFNVLPAGAEVYGNAWPQVSLDATVIGNRVIVIFRPGVVLPITGNPLGTNQLHSYWMQDTLTSQTWTGSFGESPTTLSPPSYSLNGGTAVDANIYPSQITSDGVQNVYLMFMGGMYSKTQNGVTADVINPVVFRLPWDTTIPDGNNIFPNSTTVTLPTGSHPIFEVRNHPYKVELGDIMEVGPGVTNSHLGRAYRLAAPMFQSASSATGEVRLAYATPLDIAGGYPSIGGKFRTANVDTNLGIFTTSINHEDVPASLVPSPYNMYLSARPDMSSFYGIDTGVTVSSFCQRIWYSNTNEYGLRAHVSDAG